MAYMYAIRTQERQMNQKLIRDNDAFVYEWHIYAIYMISKQWKLLLELYFIMII